MMSGNALATTHGESDVSHCNPPVATSNTGGSDENVYETDDSLNMYLGLHFPRSGLEDGTSPIIFHENKPSHALRFPQRVAELLVHLLQRENLHPPSRMNKALDVGCAVGGGAFALAKHFGHVDAFDYSHNFIRVAQQMQRGEKVCFRVPIEADLHKIVTAVHEDGISQEICEKVTFFQGDACRLEQLADAGKLSQYDGIIMANLLCRLKDPLASLDGVSRIIQKGGVVVIVTPFSWLEQFTPCSNWLGGFHHPTSKEPLYSQDQLQLVMEKRGFEKIHQQEMPLLIREHQRKYQYIVSQATGWRKL